MKRMSLIVMMLVMAAGAVFGIQLTDTITLTITPNTNLAVDVTYGLTYAYGAVDLGATTVNTAAITVKNVGNVREYWSKNSNNSVGWSLAAGIPTQNQCRMIAKVQTAMPAHSGFDAANSSQIVSGTNSLLWGGDAVEPNIERNMWIRLEVPPTVAGLNARGAQTFTFTVTCNASD